MSIILINLFLLIMLLSLSAAFSASETAFFSLNPLTIKSLKTGNLKWQKNIFFLLQRSEKLLITILICNTIVNILATSTVTSGIINISKKFYISSTFAVIFSSTFMTVIILLFGEMLPKNIAINYPQKTAKKLLKIIYLAYYLIYPVQTLFRNITKIFIFLLFPKKSKTKTTGKYLISLIRIAREEKVIDEGERRILENILSSLSIDIKDLMKPRTEVHSLYKNISPRALINNAITLNEEIIPITEKDRENIVGVIYKKDILPYYYKMEKLKSIRQILKNVIYVPEGMDITSLFLEFQKSNTDFAVVIDEYGSFSGIITLKDILLKFFKELYSDRENLNELFRKTKNKTFCVKGISKIEQFNNFFKSELKAETSETIAGYFIEKLGRLPKINDIVRTENLKFTIKKMKRLKIESLEVKLRRF